MGEEEEKELNIDPQHPTNPTRNGFYLKNGWNAITDHRRTLVAKLLVRGYTHRQIVSALASMGEVNPQTKEPWALNTVHLDVQALDARWRAQASEDHDLHKGRVWSKLLEVQKDAWARHDLKTALAAIEAEAKLLGLNEPLRIDVREKVKALADELGLNPEEAIEAAERIIYALDGK